MVFIRFAGNQSRCHGAYIQSRPKGQASKTGPAANVRRKKEIKGAQTEVQKLLDAGVIREVQYPEWLANIVMVPKKNGKW